jgi:hypothetical protein
MTYERRLLRAYARAFPQAEVSVRAHTGGAWDLRDASAYAARLLSYPVLDRCLHRGSPPSRACVPHVVCDCGDGALGFSPSLPGDTAAAALEGKKLSAKQKAQIAVLRSQPDRVLWTVLYAARRCLFAQGYDRACVLLFVRHHANMLVLQEEEEGSGGLLVTLYEPNGAPAAAETLKGLFANFEVRLGRALQRTVRLRAVGLGLQTALGEETVRRTGRAVFTTRRGYPVCAAVVLWLFGEYVRSGLRDLEAFELFVFERGKAKLQAELLRWTQDLADWVETTGAYAERLRRLYARTFESTNVVAVRAAYGRAQVTWTTASAAVR